MTVDKYAVGQRVHAKFGEDFYPAEVVELCGSDTHVKVHWSGRTQDDNSWIETANIWTTLPPEGGNHVQVRLPQTLEPPALAAVVEELRRCLAGHLAGRAGGGEAAIYVFGSALNGFGDDSSDIDTALLVEAEDECRVKRWLKAVASALHQQAGCPFQVQKIILTARIPLLKVLHVSQRREMDVTINNLEPLANTYLLRTYAALDERVRRLGVEVKRWAKAMAVCGAANGWLSSYDLVLMAIFYLQVGADGFGLPSLQSCLPQQKWQQGEGNPAVVRRIQQSLTSTVNAESLLEGFFHFYANSFNWDEEAVSVRLGVRAKLGDMRLSRLKSALTPVSIEDPILLERNLGCHLRSLRQFDVFKAALRRRARGDTSLPRSRK